MTGEREIYTQLLKKFNSLADEDYAAFQRVLLNNEKLNVIGVRVPQLRRIAREYKNRVDELLPLPDIYYEVTFVKLLSAAYLPYDEFVKRVDKCVSLIDNWATCDSFTPACIKKHREDFIPFIEKYLLTDGEFFQGFALKTLLSFYVEEEYLAYIESCLKRADTKYYYAHMGAAWLLAEIVIKFYDEGVRILKENALDKKTRDKAIQKALESFRLTEDKKTFLRTLKQ